MRLSNFSLALVAVLAASVSAAERNITIDDSQTELITYTPPSAWKAQKQLSPNDALKFYSLTATATQTQGASATFSFTGTAIYCGVYSILPSFIRIELDGVPTDVLGYIDFFHGPAPATFQQILFAQRGLNNTQHTIVIQKADNSGPLSIFVDAFVYTVDDDNSTSSTGTSSPTGTPSLNSTQDSSRVPVGAIVGGVIGGIVFIVLLVLGTVLFIRSRHKAAKRLRAGSLPPEAPGTHSTPVQPRTTPSQQRVFQSMDESGTAGLGTDPASVNGGHIQGHNVGAG